MNLNSYSWALQQLKAGHSLQREGWNGKGMFIFLVPGSTFNVNRLPLSAFFPEGTEIQYHAHIDMKTADGSIIPWLCSQTDVLAEDWQLFDTDVLYRDFALDGDDRIGNAIGTLTAAMEDDEPGSYAHGWCCNLSQAFTDACYGYGIDPNVADEIGEKAANIFMQRLFETIKYIKLR